MKRLSRGIPFCVMGIAILCCQTAQAQVLAAKQPNEQQFQFERSAADTAKALGIGLEALNSLKEGKERLTEAQFAAFGNQFGLLPNGLPTLQVAPGKYFVLIPLSELDKGADIDREANAARVEQLPPKPQSQQPDGMGATVVDHRPQQTPVRDQAQRGTCVAFASCADIEAIEKAKGNEIDLSENLAYLRYMQEEASRPCLDPGLQTWKAAGYLKTHLVCEEAKWTYVSAIPANCALIDAVPAGVVNTIGYGVDDFVHLPAGTEVMPDGSIDIRDTKTLETLLASGQNIVFGTVLAWRNDQAAGVIDVTLGVAGQPIFGFGGHAMLIVGYDRSGPKPYFIVKNSYGQAYGHGGYLYLTHDYIRTYAKYGYVTNKTRKGPVM